jgi:hypothetical protein
MAPTTIKPTTNRATATITWAYRQRIYINFEGKAVKHFQSQELWHCYEYHSIKDMLTAAQLVTEMLLPI